MYSYEVNSFIYYMYNISSSTTYHSDLYTVIIAIVTMKQLHLSIIISAIGNIITTATATTHSNNDVRKLDQEEPYIAFAGQSLVFDRCFENNVIYRACPNINNDDDDNAPFQISDECDEYIVDMGTYLDITLNYKLEEEGSTAPL